MNVDEALYINEETRDSMGYAPNRKCAQLRWGQVLNTRLSDTLAMSDELVNSLKSEAVDVSSDESKLEQEGSRQRDSDSDERQRDSVGDNDDDEEEGEEEEEKQEDEEQEEEEQEERQDRRTGDNVLNNAEEKPPVTVEPTSTTPSAALEPSTRGRKRDREWKPVVEPAVSITAKTEIDDPTQDDGGTQSTDSDGEGARRKRAKLA